MAMSRIWLPWHPTEATLAPGGRRHASFELCKDDGNQPLRDGEEIPATLRFFSRGFLKVTQQFTFRVATKNP
jgi:hypothetical protein